MAAMVPMAMTMFNLAALFAIGIAVSDGGSTIGFSTLKRLSYDFDVYTVTLPTTHEKRDELLLRGWRGNGSGNGNGSEQQQREWVSVWEETRVTLGESVSYNAQLAVIKWGDPVVERLRERGHALEGSAEEGVEVLVYVSEVDGSPQLYLDVPLGSHGAKRKQRPIKIRDLEQGNKNNNNSNNNAAPKAFFNDRPSMHGDRIIFVSTEEDIGIRAQGWNAVFSLDFRTSVTKRLTPPGITDYSPAVSPSGEWVAAASNQGRGWQREMEALNLDLYVFKAEDGSRRRIVARNAGWPTWADESTVYFHRLAEDGWWSVFRVDVSDTSAADREPERITPAGIHAFTPSASRCGSWLALATRRTLFRHIELFHLATKTFVPVTSQTHPTAHHYSPFLSPTSNKLGYHRCRGVDAEAEAGLINPRMESQISPLAGVSLVRVAGSFPVMSPDGRTVAFVDSGDDSAGLAVMESDGSGKRGVYEGRLFGLNWDRRGTGTVFASAGLVFKGVKESVRIVAIQNADASFKDGTSLASKFLTKLGTGNNAFPSPSPDGKYVVFRSGRSGHKNLYIMDAEGGEEKYLRRLTEGRWRDTMPAWSPDGEWIAFSSNRLHPIGERSFSLYLIRPNGTDLHLLLYTGIGGLAMHPVFSPDSKRIAFTSNYAGVSAEPIAFPASFQPYGTIFVINTDGTGLTRMTHNAWEDGTPSWGRFPVEKRDISTEEGDQNACDFEDVWFIKSDRNSPAQQRARSGGLCQQRWTGNSPGSSGHAAESFLQM